MSNKDTFLLGVIVKAQGIKGEVKVKPYTDTPDVLCHLKNIFIEGSEYDIVSGRCDYTMTYLKIKGVDDRDMAETFRGKEIYVDKSKAPKLPNDRYYIDDLIGCSVYDDTGELLGRLTNIMQNGANDVYAIKGAKGEILVPVLKSVVDNIDIHKREITLKKERMMEVAVYED